MTQEIPQATSPNYKDDLLGFLLIVLEVVLFVFYAVAGAFAWGIGLIGIGEHGFSTSERVFIASLAVIIGLPILICLVLCIRLNIKNRRGMSLLVAFLPPLLFLLFLSLTALMP